MIPSISPSSLMPPPPAIPLPRIPTPISIVPPQRHYSLPVDTSVSLNTGPSSSHSPAVPYSIKLVSTTSTSSGSGPPQKRKYTKHTAPKPTALDAAAFAIVQLDHSYCQDPSLHLPPPSVPPLFRKSTRLKDETSSRFKPIKYLLHREANEDSTTKQGSSKLEHLLKRTSVYDGPTLLHHPTSPRKLYNYYKEEDNVDVDVVTVDEDPDLYCDLDKARLAMNECETHVNFARSSDLDDNWEEQIVKTGWTRVQLRLFNSVMKAFHAEHLARLSLVGNHGEVVLRRNSLDLTAHRVRKALVEVVWDSKLSQWVHGVLIDNLSHHYLAIYLDVLQTLRSKAPALIDRMTILSTAQKSPPSEPSEKTEMTNRINTEALNLLIKRQWDPFSSVTHHKPVKLKCSPVFLLVPAGPAWGHAVNVRRHKNFVAMVSNLGKVITVTLAQELSTCSTLTIDGLAERMIVSSKVKLTEVKSQYSDRPVYLVGWGTGSIIAATVSLTEKVAGVVCLGWPLFGINGSLGEGSDPLLQLKHPILFVIGDRATNVTIPALEDFREDLTNLQQHAYIVAIKSADEYLRIGRYHRKHLLVTQSYADKCIVDEIGSFVNDSFDVKSSVVPTFMMPTVVLKNIGDGSGTHGGAMSRKLSVNGEPMEGLGLTLATSLPNGTHAQDEQKKSRRKSYHRKSTSKEYDAESGSASQSQSSSSSRYESGRRNSSESAISLPIAAFSQYSGIIPGVSSLFGGYPLYPGTDAASAYSAAYAVANQAAAIQHAIAMQSAEGYKQYYSQLEKYNAQAQQYVQQLESSQKPKKPRKPREPKPPGEKKPRKPRQSKAEKTAEAAAAVAATLDQTGSSSNDAEAGTTKEEEGLPWKHLTPNTPLPPPSTTMAALVLSAVPPVVTTALTTTTTTEVFAVKSLPVMTATVSESPPALRSPPLLIPTQKSPNRIPIRLCLQKGGCGPGLVQERIEASLVPVPADGPNIGSMYLPPLVPARIQPPKIVREPVATATTVQSIPAMSELAKVTEMAVENAKNLQVKLPRISLPIKTSSSSGSCSGSSTGSLTPAHSPPILPAVPILIPTPPVEVSVRKDEPKMESEEEEELLPLETDDEEPLKSEEKQKAATLSPRSKVSQELPSSSRKFGPTSRDRDRDRKSDPNDPEPKDNGSGSDDLIEPESKSKPKYDSRFLKRRHHSSSDEDYSPYRKNSKHDTDMDELKTPEKGLRIRDDSAGLDSSRRRTVKRKVRGSKPSDVRTTESSSSMSEEYSTLPAGGSPKKKTPTKRSPRRIQVNSSEDESPSRSKYRTRLLRIDSSSSDSDSPPAPTVSPAELKKFHVDDIEPKVLRTRKRVPSEPSPGRSTRRNSTPKKYACDEDSPDESNSSSELEIRPPIVKRGPGRPPGSITRTTRRVSGPSDEPRLRTRRRNVSMPEVIDLEGDSSGDDTGRVTRSGSTNSRRSSSSRGDRVSRYRD